MSRSAVLAALAGTLLAVGALAAPAAAHDSLVSSEPADDAILTGPPTSVVLEFSGDILDVNPALQITSDGEPVEVGEARIEGTTVTWDLAAPESLEAGEYAVVWAVTSQDGHPIEGTFFFGIDEAWDVPPVADPSDSPGTNEASAPSPTSEVPQTNERLEPVGENTLENDPLDSTDLSQTAEMWFIAGLVVTALVVGAVAVVLVRRGRDPNGPPGQH